MYRRRLYCHYYRYFKLSYYVNDNLQINAVYTNYNVYVRHYEKHDKVVQRARRITYIKFTSVRCFRKA